MNLAWKVMLPLGLLNLVVVATIEEFRPRLEATMGTGPTTGLSLGLPWLIFFGGWIAAGVLTPSGTDNRPIRTADPFDSERNIERQTVADEQGSELVEAST